MKAVKVFVIVPRESASALREAIGGAGGGKIGNYSYCSFSYPGVGRFKPEAGANPAIGEVGRLEEVAEEKIEFVCAPELLEQVIAAIKQTHPYEEPAIVAFEVELF